MVQGYVSPSTTIQTQFRYNYGGAKKKESKDITGATNNKYVFSKLPNTFGAYQFGQLVFGSEDLSLLIQGMNPFQVYLRLPVIEFQDIEVFFLTTTEGGYWITYSAFSATELENIDPALIL